MIRFEIVLTWMMFMELLTCNLVIGIPCQHQPCLCVNKFRVNCSHLMLTDIPFTIGKDADILVLDVSSNHLSSLNVSLMPSQLKAVQLRNNKIKTLDQSDLHMLQALIFLHLDNNNINAVHSEALLENKRLEILTLSGNHFQFLEEQNYVYKQPFLNAPGLRVLDISNCTFRIISGVMFAKLPQLEDLRLSYNHIQSLEEDTFQHLKALKILLLRRNLINKIQVGAFNSLSKLEVLDLADNYLNFLDEPELFSPLITLRYLDLSGNGLKHLHQSIFSKLWNLRALYLNRNLVNALYANIFHGLKQLAILDVSDNNLQGMPRHTMFCENKKLSYLKLTTSFMICDNCSIWNIWKWRNKRNIRAFFAKCNGKDIDDFFNSYQKRQEMLQSLTNCSLVPECEPVSFEEMPEPSSSLLYIYVTGIIFIFLLLSGILVSVILLRRYFHNKRKEAISVTTVSPEHDETNNQFAAKAEEPYISEELKKRQELFQKMEEERLKLQRELYFQHQKSLKRQQQLRYRETLERTRQEREANSQVLKEERLKDSTSSRTLQSGVDHNKGHSYREAEASRLPSVADDEREWCRADTLPVRDKYKYIHSCVSATDKTISNSRKAETRRYSAGEAYTDVIEDEYWHAKKNRKGSKSTDGIISLFQDATEVTFCQNAVPVYTEKLNDPVM